MENMEGSEEFWILDFGSPIKSGTRFGLKRIEDVPSTGKDVTEIEKSKFLGRIFGKMLSGWRQGVVGTRVRE